MKKVFAFHGLLLEEAGTDQLLGTCPFCKRERKFYASANTGQWDCKVCGKSGNIITFLQNLWEMSAPVSESFCKSRSLRFVASANAWGCRVNPINNKVIVPGYTVDRRLNQLYKYTKIKDKRVLLATPTLKQQLFMPSEWLDSDKIYVCEGLWDGIVLWEVLGSTKLSDDGVYRKTASRTSSLLADVIAVPGAGVFSEKWNSLLVGKEVVFLYDNDSAGISGCKRAVQTPHPDGYPKSIYWLKWPADTPEKTDVRDLLGIDEDNRLNAIQKLFSYIKPIPSDWIKGRSHQSVKSGKTEIQLLPCNDYKQLVMEWRKVMKWTSGLDCALSVMLASVASTSIPGDQLWVQIIGPPGCGKSTLCEALSTNRQFVVALSTIRGFHSGYKEGANPENKSLILRLKNKTLVTKDGDTLLTAPNREQILAEARDLYDRTARSDYRNGMGMCHEGVNVTWILCGTSSLHALDTSELGARFIKCVVMQEIPEELENEILRRVAYRTDRMTREIETQEEEDGNINFNRAMRITGGFINWLRSNEARERFTKLGYSEEAIEYTISLAKLTAFMRARPSRLQQEHVEREFAARLVGQYIRLAKCLALVMGKQEVDGEVVARLTKVALDTSAGRVLDITKVLFQEGKATSTYIAIRLGRSEMEIRKLLRFMVKIHAVEVEQSDRNRNHYWKLSQNLSTILGQVSRIDNLRLDYQTV